MLRYYLVFIGAMSLITLILYGADKARAKKHAWRIKEAVLLLFGLFNSIFVGGKRLIAAVGLEHVIVVDTEDALLICPRDDGKVKELLSELYKPEFEEYR